MEQVLHPQKYWEESERDLPRELDLPDLSARLGAGWREADRGTLGELDLASLTGLRLDPTDAMGMMGASFTTEAAAGWDGDLFVRFENDGQSCTLLAVVLDTETDASELFEALDVPGPSAKVKRDDRLVLVAGAAPDGAALAEAALSELRVRGN
jgi:hypothetical protein